MGIREELVIKTTEAVTHRLLGGEASTLLASKVLSNAGGLTRARMKWLKVNTAAIVAEAGKVVDDHLGSL